MAQFLDLKLSPEEAADDKLIAKALRNNGLYDHSNYRLIKRSIDARRKPISILLRYEYSEDAPELKSSFEIPQGNVGSQKPVYIIGSGPCGLFAAIKLIELGLKPIVIERGKDVRSRRRDLAALNKEHIVNEESNYCFGEGGAGTYSDGKLYTRSKKRGNVARVLEVLVAFGAPHDILVDAHPHIGTNKLPKLITAIRDFIIDMGGEVHFETKLTDIFVSSDKLTGIELNNSLKIECNQVILATGHSARDIFKLLHKRGISIESKDFALGVRVEHPQELIDQIQYKCDSRGEFLPPASYSVAHQVNKKGVYSFCMCPGGIIAPCATSPGEIVTNGWSPSKRNNPYANSGMVVSLDRGDYDPKGSGDPLKALEFQAQVEKAAFKLGGRGQTAPGQRLIDFTMNKVSSSLPRNSYQPGTSSASLSECLPPVVANSLANAFKAFGKKMKPYFTNEAILVATESRTSSPVRIPRNKDLEHIQISGLYPAGEGAGYAGGIVSAAMDGERIAEAIGVKNEVSS